MRQSKVGIRVVCGVMICFMTCFTLNGCVTSNKFTQLEKRVNVLEKREAELEELILPMKNDLIAKAQKAEGRRKFNQRYQQDLEKYTQEQMGELEELYQVANKNWGSDEAKKNLKTILEKFPGTNRTGCGLLYLGQISEGEEQEKYLKIAIQDYSDCFYGDGVQVGAYARYYLAYYYKEQGQTKKRKSTLSGNSGAISKRHRPLRHPIGGQVTRINQAQN